MSVQLVTASPTSNTGGTGDGLSFIASSVIVDNFTNQWLYVPAAQRYIPPWQYGVSLNLNGTTEGTILFQVPPGQIQNTAVTGQIVRSYWSDVNVSPSLGQSEQPSSGSGSGSAPGYSQQAQYLDTIAVNGSANKNITPPPNCLALLLLPGTGSSVIRQKVTGNTSGSVYVDLSVGTPLVVPITPSQDPIVNVSVISQTPGTGTALNIFSLNYPTQSVIQPVSVTNPLATYGQLDKAGDAISVALVTNKAGGTTILTGVAGTVVTVYGYALTFAPPVGAAAGNFFLGSVNGSTSGQNLAEGGGLVYTGVGFMCDPKCLWIPSGTAFASGEGLKVNAQANAISVSGAIYYTQL